MRKWLLSMLMVALAVGIVGCQPKDKTKGKSTPGAAVSAPAEKATTPPAADNTDPGTTEKAPE